MLTQDWMIRQIETLTLAIATLIFQKETAEYQVTQEDDALTDADRLHISLTALLKEGKLGEAEDLLFDALESGTKETLEVAVDFYFRLNELGDRQLEDGGFSREEIGEGLSDMMEQFGVVLP